MFSQFLKTSGPISMDIMVLIGVFILFFAYALYFGRERIISAILSFYPAQFLYERFPFLDKLLFLKGDKLLVINKVFIFLVFIIILDIIISRFIFSDSGYGSNRIFRTAGFSLAGVVIVLLFTYSVVNLDIFCNFSPAIDALFYSTDKIFYWNLVPLGMLFFL